MNERSTSLLAHDEPSVTRETARALIDAVREAASGLGINVAVAITDTGGHLTAFERTDGTPCLAANVAIDKAWTAASCRLATHTWNEYLANPQIAPLAHVPRLLAVGGGFPLTKDGRVIGGLGISGGTYDQDQEAAEAALAVVGFDPPE